jgi:cell division protein FtsZ
MTINLQMPDIRELKPHITVFGVGGAGGNAVNNMIAAGLQGCDFIVANTDAQALSSSRAERRIQMGLEATQGLGAGSHPEVGRLAAEEVAQEIRDQLDGVHMAFITAGMGGGTGTGAAPVIARVTRELGILTVGVVTKPFQFEGSRRMRVAEEGIVELAKHVDTLIVIPNQNLFRVANEKTTFADAFAKADHVLYSGVACITDLMVKEGLINLDFADVRTVMREMGKAMMGTGEATGDDRAIIAAEGAIANPLLDETSMRGARGLLISITGGRDLTLYEVDAAATRIREEVDPDANIILGATFDEALEGVVRVSVVATGIDAIGEAHQIPEPLMRVQAPAAAPALVSRATDFRSEALKVPLTAQSQNDEPVYDERYDEPVAEAEIDDVTIRPLAPRPAFFQPLYDELDRAAPVANDDQDEPYIPEQAERPAFRAPRMPRIEELPMPAQNQLRARDAEIADQAVEKKRMTLLERLASSFNRREEAPAEEAVEPQLDFPERRPEAVSEYSRRPAGRAAVDPVSRPARARDEQDELEIPAFLRRQA